MVGPNERTLIKKIRAASTAGLTVPHCRTLLEWKEFEASEEGKAYQRKVNEQRESFCARLLDLLEKDNG